MVDHSRIQSLYGELHEDSEACESSDAIKRKCRFNWDILHLKKIFVIDFDWFSGDFDADDSSNSKTFKNAATDKKTGITKDSINTTDKDIMVSGYAKEIKCPSTS